jgi:putative FmdB family regulatory protein
MPLYDLKCDKCKIVKEDVMLKISEVPETACPECNELMTKVVSTPNFKLSYDNKTDICDWQGNTSQYWKSYKDAKAEGKDVRPIDSNG